MQMKLIKKKHIEKEIMKKRIERFMIKVQDIICICKNNKRQINAQVDEDELDPEKFKYIDKEKTKKKAFGFLKKITDKNDSVEIKSSLNEMEG